MTRALDALLNQVLARPADLPARAVLMDALLEAGAPRGKLMALHAGARGRELTAGEKKQEKKLITDNRAEFLGPLAGVIEPKFEFSEGFLSTAAIKVSNSNKVRIATSKTVGHPLWATVKNLSRADPVLAGHEVMRSLEVLDQSGVPNGPVPTLTTLTGVLLTNHQQVKRLRTFPALKKLELRAGDALLLDVVRQPFVKQLSSLRLSTARIDPFEKWIAEGIALDLPELVVELLVSPVDRWGIAFRFAGRELVIEPASNWEPSANMFDGAHSLLSRYRERVSSVRLVTAGVPETDALVRLRSAVIGLGKLGAS